MSKKLFLMVLTALSLFSLPVDAQECCAPTTPSWCGNLFCPTLYVKGDYIYWSVRQDGLQYAVSGATEIFNGDIHHPGKVYNIHHDWDSGFKAGAGAVFDCSGWDVSALYTRILTKPRHNCAVTEEDSDLFILWGTVVFNGDTLNEARANWNLNFNVVDFDMANEFFINEWFSMRPHFGLKGAWHDQCYNTHYFAEDFTDYDIRHKAHFWGIGPRVGLDVSAHMGWCTSLFGDLSLSSLWSEHCDHRTDIATFPSGSGSSCSCSCNGNVVPHGGPFTLLNVEEHNHDVFPVLELSVGARWDMPICGGCYMIRGEICWEQQVWWHYNRFVRFGKDHCGGRGDLTLQGLTVGGSVAF